MSTKSYFVCDNCKVEFEKEVQYRASLNKKFHVVPKVYVWYEAHDSFPAHLCKECIEKVIEGD